MSAGGNWFPESDKGEKEKINDYSLELWPAKIRIPDQTIRVTGGSETIFPVLAQILRGCDTAPSILLNNRTQG